MFKTPLLLSGILCITLFSNAQTTNPLRYKDLIFPDVTINKNLCYASVVTQGEEKSSLFDLYQPKDDQSAARPLIIWMHGGGFIFGSKDAKGIRIWSKTFAQRGYVCAAINYRLAKKNQIFHLGELQKNCYYAVQDAKTAVEYFRQHHLEYHIDPGKIILAGNSAGGLLALQAAYSTDPELAKTAGMTAIDTKRQGIASVAGVINFWGGILDLNWLKNARVPIVSVLGSKDKIVSPTHKNSAIYGGVDINEKANALGIPNALKVFDGYSHELQRHFNPLFPGGKNTQKRWLEAGQFAADFLYRSLFK
ncbi:alpha/beta hydrolase [Mucilaginibacter gotjawali]|uniref:Dienelactone hydrolase n=2 Tax=Mucilaginibacter gotjawali TaxID=1550579 RepID=A0A839S9J4_9SPHI|nr:alpha/beta hydrolase [Mucilaginibacter gotjawali]MBB3054032.1 dienelactone hydrolase [Mucilaginibacter gotjawali]BAU54298.1 Acetyl esterase [Mucilaginibacter gotjawali]